MKKEIQECEENFIRLFCKRFKFSKNLYKYYDDVVFDMYDHNYFCNNKETSLKEILKALKYQKENNKNYFKIISNYPLKKDIIKTIGLEENNVLTMVYDNKTIIPINNKVIIKAVSLKDLNKIELKHYGKIYGDGFCKRRNKEFINKSKENDNFKYYGAYINNKIVGVCHTFTYKNYTCLDSLLVDNLYRRKKVASTLISNAKNNSKYLYLHADSDDYPKDIYLKLGFRTTGKNYEYFKKI